MIDYNQLVQGHIGTVHFYVEEILPMSDEQRQTIVDQDSRAAMYAIIQSSVADPGAGMVNIQQAFEKSRRDGQQRAEDLTKLRVDKFTYHQIGQKESIQELKEIEAKVNFRGWYNPDIVSTLINWEQ